MDTPAVPLDEKQCHHLCYLGNRVMSMRPHGCVCRRQRLGGVSQRPLGGGGTGTLGDDEHLLAVSAL